MSRNLVRTVFGVGAKLFALQLVTAVGAQFVQTWSEQFNNVTAQGVFIEICQALVLAGITKTIPDMFQRMVGGVATANGGALIGAAAGVAGAAVALSTASLKMATAITGAGAVVGSAAQLATTQLSARDSAPSGSARIAAITGMTARNVGSAVSADIGRRLSGQASARYGSAGFRQAADLNQRSLRIQEERNLPPRSRG